MAAFFASEKLGRRFVAAPSLQEPPKSSSVAAFWAIDVRRRHCFDFFFFISNHLNWFAPSGAISSGLVTLGSTGWVVPHFSQTSTGFGFCALYLSLVPHLGQNFILGYHPSSIILDTSLEGKGRMLPLSQRPQAQFLFL